MWLLLWLIIGSLLCAGVISHRVSVYNSYVQGSCTVSDVYANQFYSKGYYYRSSVSITYTAGASSLVLDKTYSLSLQYSFQEGNHYPCWYNPKDLSSANLINYANPFNSFPYFFEFLWLLPTQDSWIFLVFVLYGIFLLCGKRARWKGQMVTKGLTAPGIVKDTWQETRRNKSGTYIVRISSIEYQTQEGVRITFNVNQELTPGTGMTVWYHPSDPQGHATIKQPMRGDKTASSVFALLFLVALAIFVTIGWSSF